MKSRQAGNAIVIILIAVFLFGALAAVFMRGAKSGQGNLTANQARLAAQQVMDTARTIEQSIDKFRQRGCSENQISIQRDWNGDGSVTNTAGDNYNANAPSDGSCGLFESNGAAIVYTPVAGYNYSLSGSNRIQNIGCNSGVACSDLVFNMKNIPLTLCNALNSIIAPSLTAIPTDANGLEGLSSFAGTFANLPLIGDTDTNLAGKASICYQDNNGPPTGYVFYKVLIVR